jgi:hypothetical protein
VSGARRGFGPIGKARMSRDKGYAILYGKMTSPLKGLSWRLAAGPVIGKGVLMPVGNDVD